MGNHPVFSLSRVLQGMTGKIRATAAAVLVILVFQGIALASPVHLQVTSNPSNQGRPELFGDILVWKGNQTGNYDIYYRDLNGGSEQTITANTANQNLPITNGTIVAWQDSRNGNEDIYMRAISGGPETALVSGPGNQGLSDISGNRVAYVNDSAGNNDIYTIDVTTLATTAVCTDPNSQWQPRISGSKVIWEDNRNGNWDIYMKDLDTSIEEPVVVAPGDQKVADIDGDTVVWQDYRNSRYDIWMKDLDTGVISKVTDDTAYQTSPRVADDLVVWMDYRNGNYDIYMKDLTANTETMLAGGPSTEAYPAIQGGRVVWESTVSGNYDVWTTAIPDTTPPVISSLLPENGSTTGCSEPAVSASFTDNRAGVDSGSVELIVDGLDVTAAAQVSDAGITWQPPGTLPGGNHTVTLNVSDHEGNMANASWSFSTSQPVLSLFKTSVLWASMADYNNALLSVGYLIGNNSTTDAYATSILASPASAGVIVSGTSVPQTIGDIAAGDGQSLVLKYNIPPGVTAFSTTLYSQTFDSCGAGFYFPGPPPNA